MHQHTSPILNVNRLHLTMLQRNHLQNGQYLSGSVITAAYLAKLDLIRR